MTPDGSSPGKDNNNNSVAAPIEEAISAARSTRWPSDPCMSMTELAKGFPTLLHAPGVEPWDPHQLLQWLCSPARGSAAQHAAKFLLSVWSCTTNWDFIARSAGLLRNEEHLQRFELMDALRIWDAQHVAAFIRWVQVPFWH